jgi:N-carbamoylputrescine amidase
MQDNDMQTIHHEQIAVAALQASFSDDRSENWEKLSQLMDQAADSGAQLVVLPELHNGQYFCQHEDITEFSRAEPVPGPSTEFLSSIARRLNIVIVGSIFERRAAGLYHNTAIVLDSDGSLAGIYRKMHIPDDPGYYEKFYFAPGDLGFTPVQASLGKIGVLVCWDQWFPEAARLMALAGAELLVYPTAIGWEPGDTEEEKRRQLESWKLIQRSHAVANGIPVVSVNRHGFERTPGGNSRDGIEFWGNSFTCGPQGEILCECSASTDEVRLANINFAGNERVRQTWPFLRDRRIDSYAALEQRFIDAAEITEPNNEPATKGENND